jgi:hypothetical protein
MHTAGGHPAAHTGASGGLRGWRLSASAAAPSRTTTALSHGASHASSAASSTARAPELATGAPRGPAHAALEPLGSLLPAELLCKGSSSPDACGPWCVEEAANLAMLATQRECRQQREVSDGRCIACGIVHFVQEPFGTRRHAMLLRKDMNLIEAAFRTL